MTTFTGTNGNDIWTGGTADDFAHGGAGNDQLSGGGGTDHISGDDGADILNGGDGEDAIASGIVQADFDSGFYVYYPDASLDVGTERDTLSGGSGDDHLWIGYGDNLDGGDGIDYYSISFLGAPSGITFDGGLTSQTIGGGVIQNVESLMWIQGSNYADTINAEDQAGGYSVFSTVLGMGGNDHLIAGYYTDVLDGGTGDDIVDGRPSQYLSSVSGGDGNDTLYTNPNTFGAAFGGDGNDTIYSHGETYGGNGNDTIVMSVTYYPGRVSGDAGDDHIEAASQGNIIAGGSGADTLIGSLGSDSLGSADFVGDTTSLGDDMGLEHDTIAGFDGDDLLVVGYGDNADGGSGSDTLHLSLGGAASGLTFSTAGILSGQPYTLAGGTIQNIEILEYLRATEFNDNLTLVTQDNLLIVDAGAGNDIVRSQNSSVELHGGDGNDRFVSGAAGDIFDGGAGTDTIDYTYYSSSVLVGLVDEGMGSGAGGDQLTNVENVLGTAYSDIVFGNSAANLVTGNDGDDESYGGAGNDTLYGGAGADHLEGNADNDSLTGDSGNDYLDGGDGNDTLNGGDGDDILIGGAGDDVIYAGSSGIVGNSIYDGAGNDRAYGGDGGDGFTMSAGDDLYRGGAGFDYVYGASELLAGLVVDMRLATGQIRSAGTGDEANVGVDTLLDIEAVSGSAFDDVMTAGAAAMTFYGNDGNDQLTGGGAGDTLGGDDGDDILIGGGGRDFLSGGAGSDSLNGGSGFDTVSFANVFEAVDVNLATGTATVGSGDVDTLRSVEGVVGTEFDDRLVGNAVDNVLDGGVGADVMRGGLGDDVYYVDNANDAAIENSDSGNDTVISSVTIHLRDNIENLNITGAAIGGYGNGLDNRLVGNGADNILDGAAGADAMRGGIGDDSYYVDNSHDLVIEYSGEGTDTVYSSISFSLDSNVEDLILTGSAVRANGNNLANHLDGNIFDNVLNGGLGADVMRGGLGNDIYYVDDSGDSVVEPSSVSDIGDSSLPGNSGRDRVYSTVSYALGDNTEDLFLRGSASINATGNGLDNVLRGNSAANVLTGAAGADDLRGGGGADTFVFHDGDFGGLTPSSCDRIIDFSTSEGDRIDLGIVDANSLVGGQQDFAFIGNADFHHVAGELRYEEINGNTYVYGDTDGDGMADLMIRVDGLHALTSGDFVI